MTYRVYEPRTFRGASESLIARADAICNEYTAQGYTLTLRQLYYQLVARDVIPNTPRSYKNLGALVSAARRAGRISWRAIEDRGRVIKSFASWDGPSTIVDACAQQFRLDLWETTEQNFRPQVWVEKDALAEVVARACSEYRVPHLACRGYPSDSVLWGAAQDMIRQERAGNTTVILHLGDHDPSGIDMSRDLQERLRLFGSRVRVERIALTMGQIDEHRPPPNPARTTDARYEGYRAEFGDESWELDALDPNTLTTLIAEQLAPYVDDYEWSAGLEREAEARAALRAVADNWGAVERFAREL